MQLEFSGAAQQVTGSKHLLHINGKQVLLDCGLFQGHRKQSIKANMTMPFDVKSIDAVVLSHAHIDHSGSLPSLVKLGYKGPIYSTHATRDLCSVMLRDSAYIQEKDAEWVQRKLNLNEAEPLYTIEDAEKTISLFRSVAYGQTFSPVPGTKVTFHDAGHVLGSAVEEWEIEDYEMNEKLRFGFTGDLGRRNLPILKDPVQLENLDVFITESTYGDRLHDEIEDVQDHLAAEINEAIGKKGKIIIPAFALERTQEILFVIRELQHAGKIPQIPIFIDSPLATSATEIFALHPECYDQQLRDMIERGDDPFCPDCGGFRFTQSVEESKSLNDQEGPMIIISASGMCEAGRIRHHLRNTISDEKNTVLIVGFMAQNTLGRKLVEGENPIKIFGEEHELKAKVVIFNAFSGHADQKGLLRFASGIGTPKAVFCVHGEMTQMAVFQQKLQELGNFKGTDVFMPAPGEIFGLKKEKTMWKTPDVNLVSQCLFGEPEDFETGIREHRI